VKNGTLSLFREWLQKVLPELRLLTLTSDEFTDLQKYFSPPVAAAVLKHLVSGGRVSDLPPSVCRSTEPRCIPRQVDEKILRIIPNEWVWSERDERNDEFRSRERFDEEWPLLNVLSIKTDKPIWITGVEFLAQVAPLKRFSFDVQTGDYEQLPAVDRYEGIIKLQVGYDTHQVLEQSIK
jgi:hypothetical protein